MVSGIATMMCVKKTMVPTSETTVTAAKKTVSVALTMVCKVLSIGFMIVEQRFVNLKLVFLGAPARSHHLIREIHHQIQLTSHYSTVFVLPYSCQAFFEAGFCHLGSA
jgi:hypothetical protein